jgi:hypothetical protein
MHSGSFNRRNDHLIYKKNKKSLVLITITSTTSFNISQK